MMTLSIPQYVNLVIYDLPHQKHSVQCRPVFSKTLLFFKRCCPSKIFLISLINEFWQFILYSLLGFSCLLSFVNSSIGHISPFYMNSLSTSSGSGDFLSCIFATISIVIQAVISIVFALSLSSVLFYCQFIVSVQLFKLFFLYSFVDLL